jgi:hypothetical protein
MGGDGILDEAEIIKEFHGEDIKVGVGYRLSSFSRRFLTATVTCLQREPRI